MKHLVVGCLLGSVTAMVLAAGCASETPAPEEVAEQWVIAVVEGDLSTARRLSKGHVTPTEMEEHRLGAIGSKGVTEVVSVEARVLEGDVTVDEIRLTSGVARPQFVLHVSDRKPVRVWATFWDDGTVYDFTD